MPPFPAPMKKPPFVVKERFFSRLAVHYFVFLYVSLCTLLQLSLVHLHTPSDTPYYSRSDAKYVAERQDPIPSRQSMDTKDDVSEVHGPKKKRKRIIPLWLHNFLYHPLFVGILGGVLATIILGEINSFSNQSFNMSGKFVLALLGILLLVGYVIDFFVHKNK